jgi:putative serine protease PepD
MADPNRSVRPGQESPSDDAAVSGRPPWWTEPLPPVEGNSPPERLPAPPGLWGGPPPALPSDGAGVPSGPPYGGSLPPYVPFAGRGGYVPLPADGLSPGAVSRRVLVVGVVSAVVISAVISGFVAWGAGAAAGRHERAHVAQAAVLDPTASLPATESAVPRAIAAGSVTAIAAAIVPSVVTVQVRSADVRGTGAGVIIRSDGYILTNNHVVAPTGSAAGTLTVDLSAAQTDIPAQIVGRSPVDDLAVIKINVSGLRAARLGRSSSLRVGDEVVAVGAPLGLSGSVTSGIVSALARNIDVPGETSSSAGTVLGNAIQTDAAINPGNSGGALVDSTGAVVGINSAIASTGDSGTGTESGSIGVGFAIPIDYARSVAEEIIRTGKVTHPYLGLVPDTVDADNPIPHGPTSGAFVRQVVSNTPASRAGLETGDVIIALDGQLISSADDLIVDTRTHAIGQVVTITYVRDGTHRTTQATLVQNPNG